MAEYTLIQSGDADAAENVGALAGTIPVNHIVDGLALSNYDAAAPSIDVDAGKTGHVLETATAEWTLDDGTQQSEERDQVQIVAHLDAQTVGLDDGAVNHLFVNPNVGSDDSPQLVANTTGNAPTAEAVKIGEVDTAADTVSSQWRLVAADGTLTFPNEAAASAAAGELPNGTVVYTRSEEVHWSTIAGSLKRMAAWSDPDGDGVYQLPSDTDGIDVASVSASEQVGNATYATVGDVPTTLPEGAQVYVQDEDRIYVEDGT
jgi:hypothetical protein